MRIFRKQRDERKIGKIFLVLKGLLEFEKKRKEMCKYLFKIKSKQTVRKVFTFLNKRKVIINTKISYIIYRK